MYTSLILSTLTALSLASPRVQRKTAKVPSSASAWTPADGYKTTCGATSDKVIGVVPGPDLDNMVNDACSAMMPPCAYPERLPEGTMCVQTFDWPLSHPVETKQTDAIKSTQGSHESGFKVQFSVTPAQQPEGFAAATWSRDDCHGYFAQVLGKADAQGGCLTDKGLGVGNVTAGGTTSLKGTVFQVSIVQA
ncbi:hypothetical protein ACEQ8H_000621 [Pleosporales sp. CAS-2024a]